MTPRPAISARERDEIIADLKAVADRHALSPHSLVQFARLLAREGM